MYYCMQKMGQSQSQTRYTCTNRYDAETSNGDNACDPDVNGPYTNKSVCVRQCVKNDRQDPEEHHPVPDWTQRGASEAQDRLDARHVAGFPDSR